MDGSPGDDPLREESIRILLSDGDEAAWIRAKEIGRAAEHEYVNEAGEMIRWNFVEVLEVQDLCESNLTDGMEVFSRLFHKGDRSMTASPKHDLE